MMKTKAPPTVQMIHGRMIHGWMINGRAALTAFAACFALASPAVARF